MVCGQAIGAVSWTASTDGVFEGGGPRELEVVMAVKHKRPRPGSAANTGSVLKLHRRRIVLDGRSYTVITMRPDADVRFSSNCFHDTWHVLSDWRGARTLGRLLWGLSFQRHEGTLVLIDRVHLDPNPFDAAPADPIVLLPTHLTVLTEQAARRLRQRLPQCDRPEGTVRWRTHGLDRQLALENDLRSQPNWHDLQAFEPRPTGWKAVERIGGLIVLAAGAKGLRRWASRIVKLGKWSYYGMDYTYLCGAEGEVQVFRQYRREVGVARQARREILGVRGTMSPDLLERAVWSHAEDVRRRRLPLPANAPAAEPVEREYSRLAQR